MIAPYRAYLKHHSTMTRDKNGDVLKRFINKQSVEGDSDKRAVYRWLHEPDAAQIGFFKADEFLTRYGLSLDEFMDWALDKGYELWASETTGEEYREYFGGDAESYARLIVEELTVSLEKRHSFKHAWKLALKKHRTPLEWFHDADGDKDSDSPYRVLRNACMVHYEYRLAELEGDTDGMIPPPIYTALLHITDADDAETDAVRDAPLHHQPKGF